MNLQPARFVLVSGAGLFLDITMAWSLIELAGWNHYAAVTLSLGTALFFNYVCHEHWTFRRPESCFSLGRLTAFALTTLVVLVIRYAVLASLASLLTGGGLATLARLIAAAGFSVLVNYAASRSFIFPSERPNI